LLRITANNDDVAEAHELLSRIIDQHVEETPEACAAPALRRGVGFGDTDARARRSIRSAIRRDHKAHSACRTRRIGFVT